MKQTNIYLNQVRGITTNLVIIILLLACVGTYRGKLFGVSFNDFIKKTKSQKHSAALEKHPYLKEEGWQFYKKGIWQKVNAEGQILETVIFSKQHAKNVNGYGGPIYLDIHLDTENKIIKVDVGENYETPPFLNNVLESNFLNQFKQKLFATFDKTNYETVTGATFSSSAILDAVDKSAASYRDLVLDKAGSLKKETVVISFNYKTILSFLLIGFALIMFLFFKGNKFFRTLLLILNVSILGFLSCNMLSLQFFLNTINNGINLTTGLIPICIIVIVLLLNFANKKNFYCTWVCPFGSAQELLGKLTKKNITFSKKYQNYLNNLRNSLLLLMLFLGWVMGISFIFDYSIFTVFLLKQAATPVLVVAFIVLVLSVFIKRCWCRFLCPTGALLNFLQTTKN